MYANVRVKIPDEKGKVTRKTIKGTTYVYYQLDRIIILRKNTAFPKVHQSESAVKMNVP